MNLGNLGRQTFAAPLAALTLVAGGGIALAASGGDPAPQAVEHRAAASQAVEHGPDELADDRADEPNSDASPSPSPSPSLTGLCKAYRAGGYASSTKHGNVNPAWSALESAAGGADEVDEYCDDRLDSDSDSDSDDLNGPKADNPGRGHGVGSSHASEHGRH
ncbi:MAG TPA: hypothetical protein VMZ66_12605 [Aeromicrobium sp.]|nr:hypothetical protein [Aeromicrobium sp.]